MAEVNEECTFETRVDQVLLTTKTNGDRVELQNLDLSQDQATSLTWLVNADENVTLEWQVKVKEVVEEEEQE